MTVPVTTGSIIAIQNSSQSANQSVAIPADAELCLILYSYGTSGSPVLSSATLDGNAFSPVLEVTRPETGKAGIQRYIIPSNLKGTTKTLAWTWASALANGAHIFVVWLKNVDTSGDPIRGSATVWGYGELLTTPSFASDVNDLCLCIVGSFQNTDADAAPSGSGQTEIVDGPQFNNKRGAVGSKPGVSGTTTMQGQGAYGVLGAVSVKGSAGGVTVMPAAATAKGLSVDPQVVLGSLSIMPAIAAARCAVLNPTIVLSSIAITPSFAYARAVTVGPIVIGGGDINPLGEGDSPGFLAFLVASAMYNELTAAGLGAGLNEPDENNYAEWETFLFG